MPRALFGGITLLVPAAALAIATHELANDAIESGIGRLAYSLLRFAMLAAGVVATLKLWLLFEPMPVVRVSTPLPLPAVLAHDAGTATFFSVFLVAIQLVGGLVLSSVLFARSTR